MYVTILVQKYGDNFAHAFNTKEEAIAERDAIVNEIRKAEPESNIVVKQSLIPDNIFVEGTEDGDDCEIWVCEVTHGITQENKP
jgi:hypothetical protein